MSDYLSKTVMKQFANSSTLLALLADFDQWVDVDKFSADFLAYVWDLSTAQGFGLDIWGRILAQSRFIQIAQVPGDNFGFNVSPVAVYQQPFGTLDGTTTGFQLKDRSGTAVTTATGTPLIYRTDWQGQQLLYATARTNECLTSGPLYGTGWISAAWTGDTLAPSPNLAPDGVSYYTLATFSAASGNSGARLQQNIGITGPAGTWTTYFHIRKTTADPVFSAIGLVFTAGGTPKVAIAVIDTNTGAITATSNVDGYQVTTVGDAWRVQITATGTDPANTVVAPQLFPVWNTTGAISASTTTGSKEVWGCNVYQGTAGGSYIPTTTAPVTVTDYTISPTDLVTVAQTSPVGAELTWTGQYTQTGTQWQPWGQAPFYGGAAAGTTAFPLSDDYYRQLLLVKAATNIAACDCPSINALMRAMFSTRGRAFVGYDAANPMHISYHFEFIPTDVEKSIIESGLFPQPAGTTAVYVYNALTYIPFGFAEANTGTDPGVVTGFDQGPFAP